MSAAEYRERIDQARAQAERFGRLRRLWRRRAGILRGRLERFRQQPRREGDNKVGGGTPRQRLLFAAEEALRTFRPYYSEEGAWNARFALTNVPDDGYRSDCSWWFTALFCCCGLPDPNGLDGYGVSGFTGSLLEHGRVVSRRFAETHAGCGVFFGDGSAFHMAISTGEGPHIEQHGQDPVEGGTFDQFGPGVLVRYRDYLG